MLSKEELARYSRHLIIPSFGIEGQEKLKAAKVLVVGCGGLGSPLLLYLSAAGVGHIGLLDFDLVEESNLQRQVLFTTEDIGQNKAQCAEKRLKALNPHLEFTVHDIHLNANNALDIISDYDIVADGSDNFPTRYLVNDACVLLDKVNVYASIFRFEGQASVFNQLQEDGTRGPNYRDVFPEPPPPGMVPSCAEGGVLGVLPGIMGSIQANEVIKVITGIGDTLSGKLYLFEAADFTHRTLNLKKNPNLEIKGLIDYDEFCGIKDSKKVDGITSITVEEYKEWRSTNKPHQLIDVREIFEYEIDNLGGELMPLGELEKHKAQLSKDVPIVVHCRSGVRSRKAITSLQNDGFTNLYNLEGGIMEWNKLLG